MTKSTVVTCGFHAARRYGEVVKLRLGHFCGSNGAGCGAPKLICPQTIAPLNKRISFHAVKSHGRERRSDVAASK